MSNSETIKNVYYKITITFPDELFEDLDTKKVCEQIRTWAKSTCTQACISSEHGDQGGRYHHEGLVTFGQSPRSVQSINRAIRSALGITNSQWNALDNPFIKRHMLCTKRATYITGAIGYVCKENKGDVCNFGFQSTWLDEQLVIAEREKKVRQAAQKEIYVNDKNCYEMILRFKLENNMHQSTMADIVEKMNATNYDLARVRNWPYQISKWRARQEDDNSTFRAWFSRQDPQCRDS